MVALTAALLTTIKDIQAHPAIQQVNGVETITMIIINGVHTTTDSRHTEIMEILTKHFSFCQSFKDEYEKDTMIFLHENTHIAN